MRQADNFGNECEEPHTVNTTCWIGQREFPCTLFICESSLQFYVGENGGIVGSKVVMPKKLEESGDVNVIPGDPNHVSDDCPCGDYKPGDDIVLSPKCCPKATL